MGGHGRLLAHPLPQERQRRDRARDLLHPLRAGHLLRLRRQRPRPGGLDLGAGHRHQVREERSRRLGHHPRVLPAQGRDLLHPRLLLRPLLPVTEVQALHQRLRDLHPSGLRPPLLEGLHGRGVQARRHLRPLQAGRRLSPWHRHPGLLCPVVPRRRGGRHLRRRPRQRRQPAGHGQGRRGHRQGHHHRQGRHRGPPGRRRGHVRRLPDGLRGPVHPRQHLADHLRGVLPSRLQADGLVLLHPRARSQDQQLHHGRARGGRRQPGGRQHQLHLPHGGVRRGSQGRSREDLALRPLGAHPGLHHHLQLQRGHLHSCHPN